MARGFTLGLFLSLCISLSAQNHTQTIRGTVTDHASGAALPGANVFLPGTEPLKGTISDSNGRFRLEKVPIGRVSIRISFLGYEDAIFTNLELNSSKELIIHAGLTERIFSGSEVVIRAHADKSEPLNKMATVSARVFTVEETEKYAGARSDIARMAANFAGVTGADDSRNDIVIRGNTPSGLLWRLDGIDIPNPNHFAAFGTSGGPICILRNNLIANSDFLTAAFPAEYGNALAGVFDVKMISGNNERHEFLGQIAFNGIELGAEGPLHKPSLSSYILNYRYSTLDVFSKLGVQLGTGQGIPKYQDVLFKLDFPKTKAGSFSLFGFGGLSSIAFRDSEKDTTREKIDFYGAEGWDIANNSDQAVIGVTHRYLTGKRSWINSAAGVTYHHFFTTHDSVTPGTLGTFRYQGSNSEELRVFASVTYNYKVSARHSMKSGMSLTWYHHYLKDSLYRPAFGAYHFKNDFSGSSLLLQPFADWQYRISEAITLNTGLHLQYFNEGGRYSIEPRAGIKCALSGNMALNFGYGMHSQTIPVTVFYNQVYLPGGDYMRTNDRLDFSRSHHFVLSYDWGITENTRIKVETYYQHLYNIPVNAAHSDSYSILNEGANFTFESPDSLINNGTGKNYGMELTAERFLSKGFYFLATGSLYDSRYRGSDNTERNTAFNGRYTLNLLAGKEFNLKLRKKKEEKRKKTFVVNIKMTRSGGQRFTPIDEAASLERQRNVYIDELAFSKKYPDYWRTDVKLGYKMNAKRVTIEWSLEITNIFNQKNVFNQTFNRKTGESYFTYQLGRVIIPQYRILF